MKGKLMKSIDKLHNEILTLADNNIYTEELTRIADAIEREIKEGYIELPKDANGEHIHIGDKLVGKYLKGNPVVECTRLTLTNGWMVGHGQAEGTPILYGHYHKPTAEDVLREFATVGIRIGAKDGIEAGKFDFYVDEEAVKHFAKRLRLAEED